MHDFFKIAISSKAILAATIPYIEAFTSLGWSRRRRSEVEVGGGGRRWRSEAGGRWRMSVVDFGGESRMKSLEGGGGW